MLRSKFSLFVSVLLAVMCLLQLNGNNNVFAAYNGGRIIDDAVFLDSKSMSANQIQSFLVNKNSGLRSKSYKLSCIDSSTTQAYQALGASCSTKYPASRVIYYAAQAYGVSPRVILATMQKEQSLTTAANPTSWQLSQAMGYGCPTSGSCSSESNFSWQIDMGTWTLRFHYERANGNNNWWFSSSSWVCGSAKNFYKPSLYPGQNVRFYDQGGIHYRTHFISNPATSSMYCYTPHAYNNPKALYGLPRYGTTGQYYSGSYNFVYWFEKWFGSTEGTPFFEVNNRIYITGASNTYYYVPDPATLRDYGFGKTIKRVQKVSSSYLNGKTNAGSLPRIARFEGLQVYAISDSKKHYFTGPSIFNSYGFSFGEEAKLPSWASQYVPSGTDMQSIVSNGSRTFSVESGKARPICSTLAYTSLGSPVYSTRQKVILGTNFINSLSWGVPIVTTGTLIKSTAGNYGVWNGSSIQPFNTTSANDLGLKSCETTPSSYSLMSASGSTFSKLVKNSSGNLYILDKYSKLGVANGDLTSYGLLANQFVAVNDNFLNSISSRNMGRLIRVKNDTSILYLVNGSKKHVYSKSDLYGLGFNFGQVVTISGQTSQLFTTGGSIFMQGRLVRVGNNSAIYLIGNDFKKYYIPSKSIMYDYGYLLSSVISVSSSSLADYPTAGSLSNVARDPSGNYWLVSQKHKHRIPNSLLGSTYFNFNSGNTNELSSKTLGSLPNSSVLSKVFRASNSARVYIIDQGQKRYVTSPGALVNSGHTMNDVLSLSPSFVNSIPNGPNYN